MAPQRLAIYQLRVSPLAAQIVYPALEVQGPWSESHGGFGNLLERAADRVDLSCFEQSLAGALDDAQRGPGIAGLDVGQRRIRRGAGCVQHTRCAASEYPKLSERARTFQTVLKIGPEEVMVPIRSILLPHR
jgi:hypothetical protein